ncbi:QCR8 [Auxenochlorella protothecoides x Auxenochlorella symbiontica]
MGKIPVKFREVVYTLSPYEQNVMGGLWRDIPHKVSHYSTKVRDAVIFAVLPLWGIGWYCNDFKEKEKHHHRF